MPSASGDAWGSPLVFNARRYRAARDAAFLPLVGANAPRNPVSAAIRLRDARIARFHALRAAGWAAVAGDKRFAYARNCPPVGMRLSRPSQCCGHPAVCPFCWGRTRVLEPFRRFEAVLYGPEAASGDAKLLRPDLKVVWFTIRTTGSAKCPAGPLSPDTLPAHWEYVKTRMGNKRAFEVRLFRAELGAVVLSVFPEPARGRLALVRAGVLLVPAAAVATAAAYAATGGRATVAEATKGNLYLAAVRAFRFPRELFAADAALTAGLLNRMKSARLQTWYGRLPNATVEE